MKPKTMNVRLLLQNKGHFILKSHRRLVDYTDRKKLRKGFLIYWICCICAELTSTKGYTTNTTYNEK